MPEEENRLSRTTRLLGDAAMRKLADARVIVFGLGGVGGYAAEALARSGIGALDLVDADTVSVSNLNRQIFATTHTVGAYKTDAARERIESVAPDCRVRTFRTFVLPENIDTFAFTDYDYAVDAVDTVAAKIAVICAATAAGTPVVSAMGAGNKTDATRLKIDDISRTSVCPLARVIRRELRKRGIEHLRTVYSDEPPATPQTPSRTPASIAYVPAVAGLLLAQTVIRSLAGVEN